MKQFLAVIFLVGLAFAVLAFFKCSAGQCYLEDIFSGENIDQILGLFK